MKKVLLVLAAMAIIAMVMFFALLSKVANADGVPVIQNGVLFIAKADSVPGGLSADDAYKLVTGELKETTIVDKRYEHIYSFVFPLIKERRVYEDKTVRYSDGMWLVNPAGSRITNSVEYSLTIILLWMVAGFIVMLNVLNQSLEIKTGKLIYFYIAILIAYAVTGLTAGLAGIFTSVIVGMRVSVPLGALVGGIAGIKMGNKAGGGSLGSAVGAFVGVFASICSGIFASNQDYKSMVYYLVSLIAIAIASFVIAGIAISAYDRAQTKVIMT